MWNPLLTQHVEQFEAETNQEDTGQVVVSSSSSRSRSNSKKEYSDGAVGADGGSRDDGTQDSSSIRQRKRDDHDLLHQQAQPQILSNNSNEQQNYDKKTGLLLLCLQLLMLLLVIVLFSLNEVADFDRDSYFERFTSAVQFSLRWLPLQWLLKEKEKSSNVHLFVLLLQFCNVLVVMDNCRSSSLGIKSAMDTTSPTALPLLPTNSTINDHDQKEKTRNGQSTQHSAVEHGLDRNRISALLGELGAPPLDPWVEEIGLNSKNNSTTCYEGRCIFGTTDERIHSQTIDAQRLLERCICDHTSFLHVVDTAFSDLQVATRMQLGLGSRRLQQTRSSFTSRSAPVLVDRAERAYVGRLLRRQQQEQTLSNDDDKNNNNNSNRRVVPNRYTVPTVSLGVLRKLLYQLSKQQCHRLTQIQKAMTAREGAGDCDYSSSTEVSYPNEQQQARNDDNDLPIITLTLLRSIREELVDLLSQVVSLFVKNHNRSCQSCNNTTLNQCVADEQWQALEQASVVVVESRVYLESCLKRKQREENEEDHGETAKRVAAPAATTTNRQRILSARLILEHLNDLCIATRALEEDELQVDETVHDRTASRSGDGNPLPKSSQSREWWKRIQTMTKQLESMVEHMGQHTFSDHDDRRNSSRQDKNRAITKMDVGTVHSREESGEYALLGSGDDKQQDQRPDALQYQHEKYKNKTLVFLGGTGEPRDGSNRRSRGNVRKSNNFHSALDDDQLVLLEELENRLDVLPQAEEVTVTPTQMEDQEKDQQDGQTGKRTDSDSETSNDGLCTIMTMPSDNENAHLFRGELAASIALFANTNEQEEDDNHYDTAQELILSDG